MSRRVLLGGTLSLSAAALLGCGFDGDEAAGTSTSRDQRAGTAPPSGGYESWDAVRGLFDLDPDVVHLSAFILASHSLPVREAIDRHRRGLDQDPREYFSDYEGLEERGAEAAAEHLGTSADLIALTDSTSMGLGLLIGSMKLGPGDEVLLTEHEHYMASESVRYATERAGAEMRTIELYPPTAPERATVKGILAAIEGAIRPSTRLVVVTWVQTASGVRLPLEEIARVVEKANRGRPEDRRALLLVDGAHALGAGPIAIEELGCDAFVSSGHKWLLGPRGTGIAWATEEAWARMTPIIPSWAGDYSAPGSTARSEAPRPAPPSRPGATTPTSIAGHSPRRSIYSIGSASSGSAGASRS